MKTHQIGQWKYLPETLVVRYAEHTSDEYEVDLERCGSSAKMLDWIFQCASKSWATSEAIGDLVKILNQLLSPQATLCSGGHERGPLPTRKALQKLIATHLREREAIDRWIAKTRKEGPLYSLMTAADWAEMMRQLDEEEANAA